MSAVAGLALLVLLLGAIPPGLAQTQKAGVDRPERQVIAAIPRHFPPQYHLDEDGTPTGFAIDVMEAIAARTGLRLQYVVKDSFLEVNHELVSGRADIIPNAGVVAGREKTRAFTAPLETIRVSLFIRDDTRGIASLDDLAGKKVGVVETNVGQIIMAKRSDVKVTLYHHYQEALFALLAGTIDAFIFPEAVIWQAAREARVENRIRTAGGPVREVKRAIAVRKDDPALLALLAPAVDEFLATQEYRQIFTRWYGAPTPFWSVKSVAIAFGALLLASIAGLSLWRHLSLHRLNRQLRESERILSLFQESAIEGFALFDRDLLLLSANAVALGYFGTSLEQAVGKSLIELVPHIAGTERYARYQEIGRTGGRYDGEVPYTTDQGEVRYYAVSSFPAGDGMGLITRDVTERARAERELELLNHRLAERVTERTAELRAAQDELINAERLAALGQLTATVAHELRNPLGTIRTSVFSLRSKIPGSAEEVDRPFQRIDRNIARCDRIIAELLDFSANQEPQLETVDLNQCIAAWVDDYEASEGARLQLAIADSAAAVRTDQDRLHQVIANLLDNALQAQEESPGRGRRDAKIAVRTRVEGGHFILEVADDGPGIPDDILPRIFEPLFSTKGFGVGLGLPLVKKIIDGHGGDIEVVTGVGDGTTFRIRLPLAKPREAAA